MPKKLLLILLFIISIAVIYIYIKSPDEDLTRHNILDGDRSTTLLQRQAINQSFAMSVRNKKSLVEKAHDLLYPEKPASKYVTSISISSNNNSINNRHSESNGIVLYDNNAPDSASGSDTTFESKSIIFISENTGNQISSCTQRIDTTFNCHVSIGGLFGPEMLLAIQNKLYITNMNNNSLTVCNITPQGSIVQCNNIAVPLNAPVWLLYSNQQLYIADFGVKNTILCQIDSNGDLISCSPTTGLTPANFKTITYKGYNYSTDWMNNAINKCINMYSTACTKIKDPTINGPLTIFIYSNYAYITNNSADMKTQNVIRCLVDPNGEFSACTPISGNMKSPIGVAEFFTSQGQ